MKLLRLVICIIFPFVFFGELSAQKDFAKDADKTFDAGNYYSAIIMYKKAFSKERNNTAKTNIIFQIAECYRLIGDPKQSEIWYNKAIKVNYNDPISILYYADAKKANGKYDEAYIEYNNYRERVPDDPRGLEGITSCELAQEWMDNPGRYEVDNVVLINSPEADFSPVYSKKGYTELTFSSSREGSLGKETDGTSGQNYTDIWMVNVDRKGKWSTPVLIEGEVNSEYNDGAATYDEKFRTVYFTRCPVSETPQNPCKIYTANKKGSDWETPKILPLAPDSFTVGHPSISTDNMQLFFVSDMNGGYGGKDIWVSNYDKKKKDWQTPVNLGPDVNTYGDEMFPFIHYNNNTLYFSSTGHIGMGGLDIFKATLDGEKWGSVTNLKYPMNSEGDDFGIIFEGNADRGYFTSNRKGGKGGDDIYYFASPRLAFSLQGVVIDADTRSVLTGAAVVLVGDDGTSLEETTDEVGSYFFQLSPSTNYEVTASMPKYLSDQGKETTVGREQSEDLVHDFELRSTRKPIELPNILYDLDKWDLRPESKVALDGLVQTLNDNPTIVIKLMSHTDTRADDKYNIELSDKRAKSVVDYLISKEIEPDRLEYQGYGEKKLLISDSKINKMKTEEEREAAHQKNRRTEFQVLSTDYVPKVKKGEYIKIESPDLKKE